jgi:hypothetical protein
MPWLICPSLLLKAFNECGTGRHHQTRVVRALIWKAPNEHPRVLIDKFDSQLPARNLIYFLFFES